MNCKIDGKVSSDLIHDMIEDNRLKSLTLIHVNMTDEAFEVLTDMVETSKYLETLDISWCERQYNDFIPFFEMLADNKRLQNINLSWNSLFDNSPGEPIVEEIEEAIIVEEEIKS